MVNLSAVPRFVQRSWPAEPNATGARKERQSFRYEAFVPDPVGRLQFTRSDEMHKICGFTLE